MQAHALKKRGNNAGRDFVSALAKKGAFLALCVTLHAQEFVISYAMQVRNGVATHESFGLARALKAHPHTHTYTCHINAPSLELSKEQEPYELEILIKKHKEEVLDCLYKSEVSIESNDLNTAMQNQNRATLRMSTPLKAHLEGGLLVLEIYTRR